MLLDMKEVINNLTLKRVYGSLLFLSLSACLYSYFKPGIFSPTYPAQSIKEALGSLDSEPLTSATQETLDKDTSDRKLSPLYTYKYSDGSQVLGVLVRVRKRDDFKIETYGMLTKDIEEIYIKNPRFTAMVPYSLIGSLNQKNSIQTCIVPQSTKLDDVDIRLSNLISSAESLHPQSFSLTDKLLGLKKDIDYACLVLTYQPASQDQTLTSNRWKTIVKNVQTALLK
jgi:hypothetical protein